MLDALIRKSALAIHEQLADLEPGFHSLVEKIDGAVWGPVLISLLFGTGLFLTLRMLFVQFRLFRHGIRVIRGKYDDPSHTGQINHFQALSAALSATIGTGNIAGVATAIAAGGPGAVFWMWVTALFGMAIKFTSCTLAVKFRRVHPNGEISGGPMHYIEQGMGLKWLAVLFALFTVIASFGIGNMVQSNTVTAALIDAINPARSAVFGWQFAIGLILAILAGLVIIGGIRRIGRVASFLTPFMSVVYILGALIILISNAPHLPQALGAIIQGAFTPQAAIGGFAGSLVLNTIRYGVARGIFSNESGLGSAPIIYASARTDEPVREGLVAMLGPFIDTIVVCSMTALVIVTVGGWTATDEVGRQLTGAVLTVSAFNKGLAGIGGPIVVFGIVLFAFSTLISWSYYGDRSAEYLFGERAVRPYRWIYVGAIVLGAILKLQTVWNIADIFNGLMALPNLIAVLALSGLVFRMMKDYRKRYPD